MASSMILHCGAEEASYDDLHNIEYPEPTRSWHPLPHWRVVDEVKDAVSILGLTPNRERFGLQHEQKTMFGLLHFDNMIMPGVSLAVAIHNNVSKMYPIKVGLGDDVFVCDNLSFFADLVVMHKHTRRVAEELFMRLGRAVAQVKNWTDRRKLAIEAMQNRPLTDDSVVHDIMIRSMDADCISSRDLPRVLQEWREPQYEEYKPRNAWSLFNSFTVANRDQDRWQNAVGTADRTVRLNKFFEQEFALN